MRRTRGSGCLDIKSGADCVRWRFPDGRHPNRRLGKVRTRGESDGLTRAQAERAARAAIEAESLHPIPSVEERRRTVDEAADALRERLVIEGARPCRQNCESMQRVHVSPALGKRRVDKVTTEDIERLARGDEGEIKARDRETHGIEPRPTLDRSPFADPR